MKTHTFALLILLTAVLGCDLFTKKQADNTASAGNANTTAAKSPTPKELSKADFVGRWGVTRDFKDHLIELRPDGSGTIMLDEHGKTEVKQDLTWEFSDKAISFTLKKPAVDPKSSEANGLTVHAELASDGTKLKTDYSPYTRSRGEDTWDKK